VSNYKFDESEKIAIWKVDGSKCFYEGTPVLYRELQIDHIVPESTPAAKLAELRSVLPENFEINSVENWVTCHQGCNCRKGSTLYEPKSLLFYLEFAKKRAPKVREVMEEFRRARDNDKLLSSLAVRLENGHSTHAEVLAIMRRVSVSLRKQEDPWVIAFGVNFYDPLPEGAPESDPELSDWLISRLQDSLAATGAIFQMIDDGRTGETTSVRCAFWVFDFDRIQEEIDFCWDVLAAQRYSEVFGEIPDDLLDRAVVASYHRTVYEDSGDPIGISACPACGSRSLDRGSFVSERETLYLIRCRRCGHSESS
jgi:hypothetical protein